MALSAAAAAEVGWTAAESVPMAELDRQPERCKRCGGGTFEEVGFGLWDGVGSDGSRIGGLYWRVRCLSCPTVWCANPTHDELEAGGPQRWFECPPIPDVDA